MRSDAGHGSGLESVETIIESAIDALRMRRQIFYNEADFQHSLAWMIHLAHPGAAIRLEVPLPAGGRLDLFADVDGVRIAVELKVPANTIYRRRGQRAAAVCAS